MQIIELLDAARKQHASDIHISTDQPPILRVYGEMVRLRVPPIAEAQVQALLQAIMNETQRKKFEAEGDVDFALTFEGYGRYRVNVFRTIRGPAAVMRSVGTSISSLEDLNLPPVVEALCHLHKGLILVTGPTGSGKTTTLSAIINHINENYPHHIITLEDPVEYLYTSAQSLVSQREIGAHAPSFADGLRSALREDPDIIMVGELRDLDTIRAALTAAETGHLVFGTLHTNSAVQTIDRLIDVFPSDEKEMVRTLLSSSLEAILSQQLVKRQDGKGMVMVMEVLVATPAIRNLIREQKLAQITSAMQVGKQYGMVMMRDAIQAHLTSGAISQEKAQEAMNIVTVDNSAANAVTDKSDRGNF